MIGVLRVVELGEGDLGVGIDESLLVDAPDPLHVADVERILGPAIARTFALELAMRLLRSWPSPAPPAGFRLEPGLLGRPWLRAP